MIVNTYGKKLDDLDTLMLRVHAISIIPLNSSFAIITKNNAPITGFKGKTNSIVLITSDWSKI